MHSPILPFSNLLASLSAVQAILTNEIGSTGYLYAQGTGIRQLPLFYHNGSAVTTDHETAKKIPDLTPVIFTVTARQQVPPGHSAFGRSFTAVPDIGNLTGPATFESATLYVSNRTAWEAHAVGFTSSQNAPAEGMNLGPFFIDGARVTTFEEKEAPLSVGAITLFCAIPSAVNPGVWDLRWNVTEDYPGYEKGVPVYFRNFGATTRPNTT